MAVSKPPIGRLVRVDLREVWQWEATSFTPWLAQSANIDILAEAIGIDLEVESQETNVGPFRADILCRDTSNDQYVLIENQLERTDHLHLGQLLTYAAGLDTVTIVWVARRFTDEHRAALDWLNEKTSAEINFFGLEVELWRIGDSPAAPRFNVVSRPNDWSRAIRAHADAAAATESQRWHLDFWTEFHEHIRNQGIDVRLSRPRSKRHIFASLGRSRCRLTLFNNLREERSGAYLRLTGRDAKARFHYIESRHREEIERRLSDLGKVRWELKPDLMVSHIMVDRSVPPTPSTGRQALIEWMTQALVLMHGVFRPIVGELPTSDGPENAAGIEEDD